MNRLLEIGFECIGHWLLENDKPIFKLLKRENDAKVLYAFVCDGEVKYIGKTIQPIWKRMYGYQNPGSSQSTNIKNNQNILQVLQQEKTLDIFILPELALLKYGVFQINLAAGLEDEIIHILNPGWNHLGKGKPVNIGNELSQEVSENDILQSKLDDTQIPVRNIVSFEITLHKAYYNSGFFNVGIDLDKYFGEDGSSIKIHLPNENIPLLGYINRTATTNGTARIMGGKMFKKWIQNNFDLGSTIKIVINNPNDISVENFF